MKEITFWQIMILTSNSMQVLELEGRFWLYDSIQFSQQNATVNMSIDYVGFKGIDISDFMSRITVKDHPLHYIQKLESYTRDLQPINVKFNKYTTSYFCYTN